MRLSAGLNTGFSEIVFHLCQDAGARGGGLPVMARLELTIINHMTTHTNP